MTNKVLFISHSRELTGWRSASIAYQSALSNAGVDVVSRPLIVGNNKLPPKNIIDLEAKSPANCNINIQNVLPSYMTYYGYFKKNIGLYFTETDYWQHTNWRNKLSLMDELWVPCTHQYETAINSGIEIPIRLVPYPVDLSKYDKPYSPYPLSSPRYDFKFYFIGENIRRKNLSSVIHAYYYLFDSDDDVSLIIKTWSPGKSPAQTKNEVLRMLDIIQDNLKMYSPANKDRYPKIEIITDYLTDDEICGLHISCDCYLAPSFGEAINIGAIDALGFGKTPIVSKTGGFLDYINDNNGYLVSGYKERVFGMTETFYDLYTAREEWYKVNCYNLADAMYSAYKLDDVSKSNKITVGKKMLEQMSYEKVGNKMKELLYE